MKIILKWYINALKKKIQIIDWLKTAEDVSPFLSEQDRKALKLWGIPFFLDRVEKLETTLERLSEVKK